jgi:Aerobic-type carbon monoxide dehydrogenase, middle subunit CoxM/CutM homologs
MKPAMFEYHRAATLADAVTVLKENEGAKVYAGGQSLVPLMNFRLSRPTILVDINGLTDLSDVVKTATGIRVGALVRHETLTVHPLIQEHIPVLSQAAQHIGHWAIRNRGTLGGSLAHADPAAELPAAMVALDAEIMVHNAEGLRTIPARQFFRGFFTTALNADDIIVAVHIPEPRARWGFQEIVRRAGDFALAGAFAEVGEGSTKITWFGVTSAPTWRETGPMPEDMPARLSQWQRMVEDLDISADEGYRRQLAVTVAERAYRHANQEGGR